MKARITAASLDSCVRWRLQPAVITQFASADESTRSSTHSGAGTPVAAFAPR